jgi:hypothetical protein
MALTQCLVFGVEVKWAHCCLKKVIQNKILQVLSVKWHISHAKLVKSKHFYIQASRNTRNHKQREKVLFPAFL